MATLAELEARKEELEKAIAEDHRIVRYGDREVTYRSVADLRQALAHVQSQIDRKKGVKRNRKVQVAFKSGW